MAQPCPCARLAGNGAVVHDLCFGQMWLFDGIPPEASAAIGKKLIRRDLAAGEILFRQGDPADSVYLIKMGSVKIWKMTEEGRVLTLDIRKAGDLFGESILIEHGEYPVSATCMERTLTCGMDRRSFEDLVVEHPRVGLAVIRNLSRRIEQLSGKMGAFVEPSLDDRLYGVLVNVARGVGQPAPGGWTIAFPLSHEEIAFLVGAHRVSVTRTLGRLQELGKIRISHKLLFVSDLPSAD
jgi:CRP/FNR family transcriptional regulator